MTVDNETISRGYDLPAPSNKLSEDVLRLINALSQIDADMASVITMIAQKANAVHVHVIADIDGLSAVLNDKSNVGHTHTLASLSTVSIASPANGQVLVFGGGTWGNATLQISNINGLADALTSLQAQIDEIDGGAF